MSKLIFHPGSPKTATSTLQALLKQKRGMIEASGIGIILPEDMRGARFMASFLTLYRGGSDAHREQDIRDFFEPYLNRFQTVICTEETFCHDFMPSRKFGSGGIDRAQRTAEILAMAGAEQTKIVMSIRPQRDLLTSTYTHFVHRHREERDFADWLKAEVDLDRLLWNPAMNAFRAEFGRENVVGVSLAVTKEIGMDGFIGMMLDALELGHLRLPVSVQQVHNPSPSDRAVDLCRLMNREVINPRKSETINTHIVDTFPVSEFGKFVAKDLQLNDDLVERYAADHDAALEVFESEKAPSIFSPKRWFRQ